MNFYEETGDMSISQLLHQLCCHLAKADPGKTKIFQNSFKRFNTMAI